MQDELSIEFLCYLVLGPLWRHRSVKFLYREANRELIREKSRTRYKDPAVQAEYRAYRASHMEQLRAYGRRRSKNRSEVVNRAKRLWREKNREKVRKSNRERQRRAVQNLSDVYVKQRIHKQTNGNLLFGEIPKELILLERELFRAKRILRCQRKPKPVLDQSHGGTPVPCESAP